MRIVCFTFNHLLPEAERFIKETYSTDGYEILDIRKTILTPSALLSCLFRRSDIRFAYIPSIKSGEALDIIGALIFFSRAENKSIIDINRNRKDVYLPDGLRYLSGILVDIFSFPLIFVLIWFRLTVLERFRTSRLEFTDRIKSMYYLRTDYGAEPKAGGSVAHTTGVLKGFLHWGYNPEYYGAFRMKAVEDIGIKIDYFKKIRWLRNLPELSYISFCEAQYRYLKGLCSQKKPGLIYQRYSLDNYSGAFLSKRFEIPFILEYNGSDVWVAKNWGTPLFFEKMAEKIEIANLKAADLIVVISNALRDELLKRGIQADKILVNPNGVDESKYRPEIEGKAIRDKYQLGEKTVIGFIGTFGKWHGAEVLAEAIKVVIKASHNIQFLFIGDGITMPMVKEIVRRDDVFRYVTFTGLVPQDEAPEYLAACDILVSPHVPNPDGTPFFGSPTKLFEYMAIGKAIVASDLDQIGEVLEHEKTAWMVKPADVKDLAGGIIKLVDDEKLRIRLGRNAREEVVAKYTWTEHVRKILKALERVMGEED
jgi:glycosyltransferase involved in cell wall biosynthesis